PRASRTVPYVSKATGLQLAKIAARCKAGTSLDAQGIGPEVVPAHYSVKEAVFAFAKFPGVDTILGPEMTSTGELVGVGITFDEAFVTAHVAAGVALAEGGGASLSVPELDKPRVIEVARGLHQSGFKLFATKGTAAAIAAADMAV